MEMSAAAATPRTLRGAVETSQGLIRHRPLRFAGGAIEAPVAIVGGVGEDDSLPAPQRGSRGRIGYALPGGRVVFG